MPETVLEALERVRVERSWFQTRLSVEKTR